MTSTVRWGCSPLKGGRCEVVLVILKEIYDFFAFKYSLSFYEVHLNFGCSFSVEVRGMLLKKSGVRVTVW